MDSSSPPSSLDTSAEARYLRWIAIYSLCKGLLLVLLAIGVLGFLHADLDVIVKNWMSVLGFNMENRHIVRLLARLDKVTPKQLAEMSGITFAVAGVFLAEGIGLLMRQQWAKYLTIAFTASFVPIEAIGLSKHFGWLKLTLLVVNLLVVAFLLILTFREKKRSLCSVAAIPATPAQTAVGCESA